MNFRIIINSIIVIFIIHIIILNINASYNIGNKKNIENFEDNKDAKNNKDSMNFLTSNNDVDNDDFKKKLLKYIQVDEQPKMTEFEKKNLIKVEASNTYLNDNNVPNFESNVADISKFYKVNYDNLSENELKSTSIDSLKNTTTVIDTKKDSAIDPFVRQSTVNPDNWSYKDEIPMNGGLMNGIVGFDSLESQFAMFNPNKLNLETPDSNKFENIPHDDLRKPIVYEN
jgi:hypothetical protein